MKKVAITIVLSFIGILSFAQTKEVSQRIKYVTQAPDGSVAMTIIDDSREDNMKVESADNFYRYEILEPTTSEAIYTANNNGKECNIDKSKVAAGTYDLRLYTSNFVITSKITVSGMRKFSAETNEHTIAANTDH